MVNVNRRINIKIEDSLVLRLSILYMTIVSLISSWYFLELSIDYISFVIFLTTIGFLFSYKNRYKSNIILKLLMTFLMLYFLREFFRNLLSQPYDPRIPLAVFLINLNTIHSFDLPTRIDLSFSFFISLILMVISGIFARESTFIVFLFFYIIGLTLTLALLNNYRPSIKYLSSIILLASLISFLIFPMIPKSLPFTFRQDIMSQIIQRISTYRGEIRTPDNYTNFYLYKLPEGRNIPPLPYNPENYFGFAPFVDLRQRGFPSSTLIFRVLTPYPIYHRGLAFDTYNGFGWYQSLEEKVDVINTVNQPFDLDKTLNTEENLIRATYFIEKDLNNLVFLPYNSKKLYFPAPFIYKDIEDDIRSPFDIPKKLIYTSLYMEKTFSAKALLNAKVPKITKSMERYLNLPNIPKRVKDLTLNITKNYETPWEKLMAIEKYLKENYPYSLDIPPLKDDLDAVDDFLFVTKKGYCEQFATAFAVMSRIIGIPSRFVTGFSPGRLNPWTGMYEIKNDNAHAWVEVYLEPIGWIPIDPTPESLKFIGERGLSNFSFFGLIFESLGNVLKGSIIFLYKLSTLYKLVISLTIILLIVYLMMRIINRYRMNKEDRIFEKVIRKLTKEKLITPGNSLYNSTRNLNKEIREFISDYYALKFAPLNDLERKRLRNELIKKGKIILKTKFSSQYPTNGQGLNKNHQK
ncbi:MAG: transglutaminase [Dictyoglomus sp. NZ13-RE01]|nr:MAG: transglutaminase [Dictyoglomus sp. NZ13-RE01]